MCGGVQYQGHKIFFPQPDAKLPIKLRGGGATCVTWGRRQKEAIGKFPKGGWARLDSIKMGKWKPWHPRPVLIPIESFLEKDHDSRKAKNERPILNKYWPFVFRINVNTTSKNQTKFWSHLNRNFGDCQH